MMTETKELIDLIKHTDVEVGFISLIEKYVDKLLKEKHPLVVEILQEAFDFVFDKEELLVKLIESVSSIDYELLKPHNVRFISPHLKHESLVVQEAVVASFEKWEDKQFIPLLKNHSFEPKWLNDYLQEVIQYLEEI